MCANKEVALPFDLKNLNDGALLSLRFHGFVTESDLLESYRRRYDPATLASRACIVADFTEAEDIAISPETIDLLSEQVEEVGPRAPDLIFAGVYPRHLDFGLARLHAVHESRTGWRLGVFRTRGEVSTWMKKQGIQIEFSSHGAISSGTLR